MDSDNKYIYMTTRRMSTTSRTKLIIIDAASILTNNLIYLTVPLGISYEIDGDARNGNILIHNNKLYVAILGKQSVPPVSSTSFNCILIYDISNVKTLNRNISGISYFKKINCDNVFTYEFNNDEISRKYNTRAFEPVNLTLDSANGILYAGSHVYSCPYVLKLNLNSINSDNLDYTPSLSEFINLELYINDTVYNNRGAQTIIDVDSMRRYGNIIVSYNNNTSKLYANIPQVYSSYNYALFFNINQNSLISNKSINSSKTFPLPPYGFSKNYIIQDGNIFAGVNNVTGPLQSFRNFRFGKDQNGVFNLMYLANMNYNNISVFNENKKYFFFLGGNGFNNVANLTSWKPFDLVINSTNTIMYVSSIDNFIYEVSISPTSSTELPFNYAVTRSWSLPNTQPSVLMLNEVNKILIVFSYGSTNLIKINLG
jgi:hypothetical protein